MKAGVAALWLVALGACQLDAGVPREPQGDPVPALRADADPQDLARIEAAITELLGGARVDLAPDAFRGSSRVTVERRPLQRLEGRAVGREMTARPARFELRLTPSGCEIVRLEDGQRLPIGDLECVPERRQ